jgi:hypothetical protein
VLLKSLELNLEVSIPVHQRLIRVVDSLQVSVEASFVHLKRIVFSLQILQRGSEIMRTIIFLTIDLQLHFLLVHELIARVFILVDFDVENMDH